MTLVITILWFNFIVIFILASYPIYVYLKSLFFKKPIYKSADFIRPVSIIIVVWNEVNYIKQKMDSFLHPDEWINGSEIIVISGGSDDGTNEILNEFAKNDAVTFIAHPERLSKIQGVNKAVKMAKHEILIFSDCRQIMKPNSVKHLVQNFSDLEIGTVTSTLIDHNEGRFSMRKLLNFISQCESKSGSSLNVFGALYAQRKSVFRAFPETILFDDIYTVVSTLNQAKRLISEKESVIYDVPFEQYYQAERIGRLTNGLLIFLTKKYRMIFHLPFNLLSRFLIFKYFKLLIPFVVISSFICLGVVSIQIISPITLLVSGLICLLVFMIPALRLNVFHLVKINFYFFTSTIKFIFEKKHSTEWEKLDEKMVNKSPTSS